MYVFLSGMVLSVIGSLPPGLISLSVAQHAMRKGFLAGIIMSAGAAVIEFIQAFIAVNFTNWFIQNPTVVIWFKMISAPVFLSLGLYFLLFAKPISIHVKTEQTDKTDFLKGVAVSVFNLLAIPYWIFYCGWLRGQNLLDNNFLTSITLSIGVMVGTFLILSGYAFLGKKIIEKSDTAARWANIFVGLIFCFLGLQMFYQLVFGK